MVMMLGPGGRNIITDQVTFVGINALTQDLDLMRLLERQAAAPVVSRPTTVEKI